MSWKFLDVYLIAKNHLEVLLSLLKSCMIIFSGDIF